MGRGGGSCEFDPTAKFAAVCVPAVVSQGVTVAGTFTMFTISLCVFGIGVGVRENDESLEEQGVMEFLLLLLFSQSCCFVVHNQGEYPLASTSAVERSKTAGKRGRDVVLTFSMQGGCA